MRRGNLFVLSAPSGAGKSSVLSSLIEMEKTITTSVSHTTRKPRGSEKNGLDYYFISRSRFLEMAENEEFLEFAEVFGNLYGTSKRAIAEKQEKGLDVILEIDWQGAAQLMKLDSDITSIFLLPPSLSDLEARLQKRGQDSQESINRRLAQAEDDMRQSANYQHVLTNNILEETRDQLFSIIKNRSKK